MNKTQDQGFTLIELLIVIVVLGTVSAILVQTPLATFKRSLAIVGWIFKPPFSNPGAVIEKITGPRRGQNMGKDQRYRIL